MITEIRYNDTYSNGILIHREEVVADVTAPVTKADIISKMSQALASNAAFLDLANPTNAQVVAQVRKLTRECSGMIRMWAGDDLLVENTDT